MSRLKNILGYFFGALAAIFKTEKQDYVFSISQPPVLGGLLGVWGKWVKHARFIYNIQDFNPEQTLAVNYSSNSLVIGTMAFLDKFSCRHADKVIVVGRDMADTLKNRFKNKRVPRFACINNWIDEEKIHPLPPNDAHVLAFRQRYNLLDKFVFLYSGNIGLYYDLENLLSIIEQFRDTTTPDGRKVIFAFVGAGALLDKLTVRAQAQHMDHVIFIPYQEKDALIYSLNAADIHWCINAKGIKGVSVPSKIYGIMAAGKPVLGVLESGSEARMLIEESGCGLCCEPGCCTDAADRIRWFIAHAGTDEIMRMGARGRAYLTEHLTKADSIRQYAEEILSCQRKRIHE